MQHLIPENRLADINYMHQSRLLSTIIIIIIILSSYSSFCFKIQHKIWYNTELALKNW